MSAGADDGKGQKKMLKGMDHVTINVADLERSLDFYGRILGMERLDRIDLEDHSLYYFRIEGHSKLELIAYAKETERAKPGSTTRGIYRHIAFNVDSVAEMRSLCDRHGIKILSGPEYISKLRFKGMLVEDPNGVEIEFVERD